MTRHYCFTSVPIRAFRTSVASQTMRLPRSRPSSSIGSRLSMWPELSLVDAVAAQLLQPARKTPRGFQGNAELQVFLLPHPAPAIGAGQRKTPATTGIGAAAVPERAVEQHHAAGRHRRGDGIIFLAVFGRAVVFVAARQNPGRAVVLPEVRQRPDRVEGDRDVRTRQRNQLGVLMDRLRLLAGPSTSEQNDDSRHSLSSTRSTTGSTLACSGTCQNMSS